MGNSTSGTPISYSFFYLLGLKFGTRIYQEKIKKMNHKNTVLNVAVIGGGPSGLMAAETLAQGGAQVTLFDAMPSVGRKFLLAGKGGLNLTHAEDLSDFVRRYGNRQTAVGQWLD